MRFCKESECRFFFFPIKDYTVTVLLDMPESPVNRKLGMFMSCLQLKSATGEVAREMCKSSMLQYRSWLLRQIETVVFAPFLLTGYSSERQMITYARHLLFTVVNFSSFMPPIISFSG